MDIETKMTRDSDAPDRVRRELLRLLIAASLGSTLAACGGGGGSTQVPAEKQPAETGWALDMRLIAVTLIAAHPDPKDVLKSSAWTTAVNKAASGAANRSFNENLFEAMSLFGLLGDAHTIMLSGPENFGQVPVRFDWIGSNVYVSAATQAFASYLGVKLVSIDGMSIPDVMDKIALVRPYYNSAGKQAGSPKWMACAEFLFLIGVAKSRAGALYSVEMPDGSRQQLQWTIELQPQSLVGIISRNNLPYWRTRSDSNYWWGTLAGNTVMYLRYFVCSEDPRMHLSALMDQVVDSLNQSTSPRLVVDVRGNAGGESALFVNALQGASTKLRSLPKTAILFDRDTFSAGLIAVFNVKSGLPSARTFGEPSGQALVSPGTVLIKQLPETGLRFQYATTMYSYDPGNNADTYTPDELIELTLQDVLVGADPVLTRALAWLN